MKIYTSVFVLVYSLLVLNISGQGLKLATPTQLRGVPLAHTPYSGSELPPSKDLSRLLPPPGQQGKQNSCVGWAVAYALKSYQEKIEMGHQYIQQGSLSRSKVFSPAFIYNQINQGQDGGSTFIDAFNILTQQGAATWEDMPYNERDFLTKPTSTQKSRAKRFRIDTWRQVNVKDLKEIKAQINAGYPVVIGATLYPNFINWQGGGIYQRTSGDAGGGHAMVLVGYNDTKKAFKILNSWGSTWGDQGYAWCSYQIFLAIVNEGYVAKDAINGTVPQIADATRDDVLRPTPNNPQQPTQQNQIGLNVVNITHNVTNPQSVGAGMCMLIRGQVFFPPGVRGNAQIVVQIFRATPQGKGNPLPATHRAFATAQGFVASGTGIMGLNGRGGMTQWHTYVPYAAIGGLASGMAMGYNQPITYALLAEPVLYLDGFGVGNGGLQPFRLVR